MSVFFTRNLEQSLISYLDTFSIVGITGPRQSGKTTLVKEILADNYEYISFDDFRIVDFFQNDPEGFIKQYNNRVIFDEVQKVPEIFNYLKIAVDNDRDKKGKFVITGSSQFSFIAKISESLAGRIGLLTLLPMQFEEIPETLNSDSIFKGSYPELIKTGYHHSLDWYSSYLETFVLRDVKSLINIGNLRDFRQFIALLASLSAQILNLSEVSRTLGIPVSTIKRWISVLEASYIIFLLPSFHFNLGKRIIKSPKLYFFDTGLVCFLTNITNKELYENGPMAGSLFENFIIADLKKNSIHKNLIDQMYFYRTSNGVEIDLVVDSPDGKSWIEIKKSHTFRTRMLNVVEKILSDNDKGFLVYEGDNFPYKKNIKVLNYKEILTGHFIYKKI